MMEEAQARVQIVEAGRRMRARQLVVAREGNLSARLGPDLFLTTPAGVDKGELRSQELVLVDGSGRSRDGQQPSSETPMHLAIYEVRADVAAITHGHPPHATAFAAAGRGLEDCVLPEVVVDLGRVPLSEYGTPSTDEIPRAVQALAREHHAILLRNHGVVTMGADPMRAVDRLETVEQLARITWIAAGLGGVMPLSEDQVAALMGIREGYGLRGNVAACTANSAGPGGPVSSEEDRLRRLVEEQKHRTLGRG
jgi:L-fuculose-phosphate aldolase